jgi:hypothetical protein
VTARRHVSVLNKLNLFYNSQQQRLYVAGNEGDGGESVSGVEFA